MFVHPCSRFLQRSLLSLLLILNLAASDVHGATYTVAADGTGDFLEVDNAVDQATCGDIIEVEAGEYDEVTIVHTASYPKECAGGLPLIIRAVDPVVDPWTSDPGAGDLSTACVVGTNPWDIECDRTAVAYVPRFRGTVSTTRPPLSIRPTTITVPYRRPFSIGASTSDPSSALKWRPSPSPIGVEPHVPSA